GAFRRGRCPASGAPRRCSIPSIPTIPHGGLPMTAAPNGTDVLRAHAENAYADELSVLAAVDDRPRPPSWRLSPWAVTTYILGGTLPNGAVITPKYLGQERL